MKTELEELSWNSNQVEISIENVHVVAKIPTSFSEYICAWVCGKLYRLGFKLIFQAHFMFGTYIGAVWMGINENVLDRKQLLNHP